MNLNLGGGCGGVGGGYLAGTLSENGGRPTVPRYNAKELAEMRLSSQARADLGNCKIN
jgi:hypothetical protein